MHARIRFRQLQVFICSHSSRALIRPRRPYKTSLAKAWSCSTLSKPRRILWRNFRLREVLEDELGLEDTPEIPIGAVETVLGAEAYQPIQGH